MWGMDSMIYFTSERDGNFNLWKISPKGAEPIQVTRHTKDGVVNPSISPDGTTIVYENESTAKRTYLSVDDEKPQILFVILIAIIATN